MTTPRRAVRRAWIAAAVAASASADASARCFTYCGKASHGGGLASFFYFLNTAKLIADDEGARFLVPEVVPLSGRHGHGKDKRFGDVLGAPEWACGRRRGQRWPSPGGRRDAGAGLRRLCQGLARGRRAGAPGPRRRPSDARGRRRRRQMPRGRRALGRLREQHQLLGDAGLLPRPLPPRRAGALPRPRGRDDGRDPRGGKRARTSQLQRLLSRSFSTRFGWFLDERSSLGTVSKHGCGFRNKRDPR